MRRVETLTVAEGRERTAATAEACEEALAIVHGSLGIAPPVVENDPRATAALRERFYDRIAEQAVILASGGWTPSMLRATTVGLSQDPDVDDKVRYGRCLGAVDFERVRRRGYSEQTVKDDDGEGTVVERVVVTRTGYAFKVAAAKDYTALEMRDLWFAGGSLGQMCDGFVGNEVTPYEDAMFTPVEIAQPDGTTVRRFRLKG